MMYSELQTTLKDNSSNNGKGRLLEAPVKTILHNLDYTVDSHHITSGGLDIVATKGTETVIAECINWYGGYIHPKRFLSITKNLAQPGTHKFLFCCGVYPTQEQCRVLHAMNVNIIHLEEQILRIDYRIIQQLRSQLLGVITTVDSTDCLINREPRKVKKENESNKTEELNTHFECFRVRKKVPKQAYNWKKRFLEVYSREHHERIKKIMKRSLRPMAKISIEKIKKCIYNTRVDYDLEALDIEDGLIHKPLVRQVVSGDYEIVAGHRRIEKLRESGVKEVDVVVKVLTDKQVRKMRRVENSQRKSLTLFEEVEQIKLDRKNGDSIEEISKDMQVSESYIYQRLQLSKKISQDILYAVQNPSNDPFTDRHTLTFSKARLIMNLPNDEQMEIFQRIIVDGLTEKQVSKLIKKVATIKDKVYSIADTETRERVEAQLFPNIYENDVTTEVADTIILRERGLEIPTSQKLIWANELITKMQGFASVFPESCEFNIKEEEGNTCTTFKLVVNKEDFGIVKDTLDKNKKKSSK